MPPDPNRVPSFAGREIRLGRRKPSASSCRDEVVAALSTLTAHDTRPVFTVCEVYTEMVASGTRYAELTVFKTMKRMKEPTGRPPYMGLERVAREGFRIQHESWEGHKPNPQPQPRRTPRVAARFSVG